MLFFCKIVVYHFVSEMNELNNWSWFQVSENHFSINPLIFHLQPEKFVLKAVCKEDKHTQYI